MAGYWFRNGLHMRTPVSPLAATVLLPALERHLRSSLTAAGGPGHLFEMRVEGGFVYDGFTDTAPLHEPPDAGALGRQQAMFLELPQRWERAWLPDIQAMLAELRSLAPAGSSPEACARALDRAGELTDRMWAVHFELYLPLVGGTLALDQALAEAGIPGPEATALTLIEGFPNEVAGIDAQLRALGARVEEDAALRALLEAGEPEALVERLRALPLTPAGALFHALWPRLAERPPSFDLFEPTWGEDPAPFARALAGGIAAEKQAAAAGIEHAARREATERKVRAAIPPGQRAAFEALLAANRAAWPLMQTHHYWIDQVSVGVLRHALLRIAQPLAGRALASAEEVVFLRAEELRAALGGTALPAGLVERRRRERDAALRHEPPSHLGVPDPAVFANPALVKMFGLPKPETAEGPLQGMAASPGCVRARARVVRAEADLDELAPGEALVAHTTEPSWTTHMARAAAMVTETGGVLCHAAIVARELQVPAVTGAAGALRRIRNGDLLEVDGGAGVVRVVAAAPLS